MMSDTIILVKLIHHPICIISRYLLCIYIYKHTAHDVTPNYINDYTYRTIPTKAFF